MELPFGENPFNKKSTLTVGENIATTPPPPLVSTKNTPTQRHKKRDPFMIMDPLKVDATKKAKTPIVKASPSASMIMGDLAKDSFKDEDFIIWS